MKIALLHYNFLINKIETNTKKIIESIQYLKNKNIDLLITPELALTGYGHLPDEFLNSSLIEQNLKKIEHYVHEQRIPLLLGTIYKNKRTRQIFNSCLWSNGDNGFINIHNKLLILPTKNENWAHKGTSLKTFLLKDIRFGVLICADAWIDSHAHILSKKGTDFIIVLSAWSKKQGGSPEQAFLRSNIASQCPLIVANQTGANTVINLYDAQSMYFRNEQIEMSYCGPEAILILELDVKTTKLMHKEIVYMR